MSDEFNSSVTQAQRVQCSGTARTPRPSAADAARQIEQLKSELAALSNVRTAINGPANVPEAPRKSGLMSRIFGG